MAYPASTKTLQQWVQEIDSKAAHVKTQAQQQHTLSAAGQLTVLHVGGFFNELVKANVLLTAAGSVAGLPDYLTAEKQGGVADPAAEFTAMRNAIVATLDWLRANVPGDTFGGQEYKLGRRFPADNVTESTPLTFTVAQTNTYRTVLTTLIGTIG